MTSKKVKNSVKIRNITRADIHQFNDGEDFAKSLRGIAVERDGEVLAIAGVLHTNPPQVFSNMTDDMRNYPVMIMKTAKRLLRILKLYDVDLYAWASNEERDSESFLSHLGFEYAGTNDDGRYFKWQRQ